jgi:hypothetical protein
MRDDFPKRVIETLAKRVGYRCSNPSCRQPTSGPHSEELKVVSIGVAAHITAASPRGPRYDADLLTKDRQSVGNGIWLCQSCSKLIDSDENKYTVLVLKGWREDAERRAANKLESRAARGSLGSHATDFAVDDWTVWRHRGNRPGDAVPLVSQWGDGDIRYSCKIRLRNRLNHEEQLHRLQIEFRQGTEVRFAEDTAIDQGVVSLPPKRWTTIEVSHGLYDWAAFYASDSVWFSAQTVGDNQTHSWLITKLDGGCIEAEG